MTEKWIVSWNNGLLWAVTALLLLLVVLAAVQYDLTYHTVRIYNWDGKRYRFHGRVRLRKRNDTYVAAMRERMGDMSFTTRYLLLPSRKLVRRHRYRSLLFRAGETQRWLPVEERMRTEALYVYRQRP